MGARTGDTPRGLRGRALTVACLLALALSLVCAASAVAKRTVAIAFSCTTATYTFEGFPSGKEDTVTELVRGEGGLILAEERFTFTGPSGSNTLKIALPAGHHLVKAESHWRTNGAVGESGKHRERLECAAAQAALSVQKLQTIAGSEKAPTAGELSGKTGQTIDYKIIVSNTGNVPLVLSDFSDPNCEAETIMGGQGETPLAPGAQTTYTCSHTLNESGTYTNVASLTGTPEEGGKAIVEHSNKVVATATSKPQFEVSKLQEIAGSNSGYTAALLNGTVGQTVDYEIVVKNTGNVAIVLSEFTDIYCDPGTTSGGPGAAALAAGASTAYTCTRKLTEVTTDENVASVTGTGVGSKEKPQTEATNTVKVKVAAAPPTAPSSAPPGTTTGTPGSTTGTPGSGGVLSAKAKKRHKKKVPHTTSHRKPRFTG